MINYDEIKAECYTVLPTIEDADISIIIPVYERVEFKNIICSHFKNAIDFIKKNTLISASLTFVEHGDAPAWKPLITEDWVNYIYIPKKGLKFNKCLCHNVGALFSQNAKFYLFHDVDVIVPDNFLVELLLNIRHFDAVQSFTKQRLNYCNRELTGELLNGQIHISKLPSRNTSMSTDNSGKSKAQGGSMFMKNKLFYDAGGFDCRFTEYSVEDAFFFDKLKTIGRLGFCDSPAIELYHLHHEPSAWGRVTKDEDFVIYNHYMNMTKEEKIKFIEEQSSILKQFKNEALD